MDISSLYPIQLSQVETPLHVKTDAGPFTETLYQLLRLCGVGNRRMNEYEAFVEWLLTGKHRSTRKIRPCPAAFPTNPTWPSVELNILLLRILDNEVHPETP